MEPILQLQFYRFDAPLQQEWEDHGIKRSNRWKLRTTSHQKKEPPENMLMPTVCVVLVEAEDVKMGGDTNDSLYYIQVTADP